MVKIERLGDTLAGDVDSINNLASELSKRFKADGLSVDVAILQEIIESNNHDLLIARDRSKKLVGMAAMSLIIAPVAGRIAYLEDFVVSEDVRGQKVGSKLWREMIKWGKEKQAERLEFTSRPEREDAHSFYEKMGAVIRDTSAYRKMIEDE